MLKCIIPYPAVVAWNVKEERLYEHCLHANDLQIHKGADALGALWPWCRDLWVIGCHNYRSVHT